MDHRTDARAGHLRAAIRRAHSQRVDQVLKVASPHLLCGFAPQTLGDMLERRFDVGVRAALVRPTSLVERDAVLDRDHEPVEQVAERDPGRRDHYAGGYPPFEVVARVASARRRPQVLRLQRPPALGVVHHAIEARRAGTRLRDLLQRRLSRKTPDTAVLAVPGVHALVARAGVAAGHRSTRPGRPRRCSGPATASTDAPGRCAGRPCRRREGAAGCVA